MATREDIIPGPGSEITGLDPTKTYRSRVATRRGSGISDPGPWSAEYQPLPAAIDPPAGLPSVALWLDADDAGSFTLDAGNVVEWRDKSGNDRHLVAATTGARPARTGGINGRSVVNFAGAQVLQRTASDIFRQIPGAAIFMVARGTFSGSAIRSLIMVTANDTPVTVRASLQADAAGKFSSAGRRLDGDSFQSVVHPTTPADNATHVLGAVFDWSAAQLRSRLNEANHGPVAFQAAGSTSNTASGIFLGAAGNSSAYFVGDIAEVIVTDFAPSLAQIQQIEAYLADRWVPVVPVTPELSHEAIYSAAPTGASSTSPSLTIGAGRILVDVLSVGPSGTNVPLATPVADNGRTWSLVTSTSFGSGPRFRLQTFQALTTGPTTGPITIGHAAGTVDGHSVSVTRWAATTGTPVVLGTPGQSVAGVDPQSITLDATVPSGDRYGAHAFWGKSGAESTVTPLRTDWDLVHDEVPSLRRIQVHAFIGAETAAGIDWSGTAAGAGHAFHMGIVLP